jgi:hypothetical protein
MRTRSRVGLTIIVLAGAAAALLPVASAQNDPAPRVDVFREQSAADLPRVTLPRGVVEAASAYETYLRNAASIRAAFRDGEAVNQAMTVGEAYQPAQMEEGLIAYSALIAMEDERFVNGVRRTAIGREDRAREADLLLGDPANVETIAGAEEAGALVSAVLREDGRQLFATGHAVKQSAYEVQHQAWSKQTGPDPGVRLARAKSLAATAVIPAPQDVSRLFQAAAAFRERRPSNPSDEAGMTPLIRRGLTLAALAVLGQANDEQRLAGLLSEGRGAQCMKMAKLNLYQCLAVAGPHYEDIFCLGQHALMDTGQCVAASGGQEPARMESMLADRESLRVPVVAQNTLR